MIRKIVIETDEAVYEIVIEYSRNEHSPREEKYAIDRAICSLSTR